MLAFLTLNTREKDVEVQLNNRTVGFICEAGFRTGENMVFGVVTFSPDDLLEIAERTRAHILEVELAKSKADVNNPPEVKVDPRGGTNTLLR